jgi:hypothetical protein
MEPDYTKYSRDDLLEVMETINKDLYPERYQRVIAELSKKSQQASDHPQIEKSSPLKTYAVSAAASAAFLLVVLLLEEFPISRHSRGAITREADPGLYWALSCIVMAVLIYNLSKLILKWRSL